GEAFAAAALGLDLRVTEDELLVEAGLHEVDLGAVDRGQAFGIDAHGHAVLLEHHVVVVGGGGNVDHAGPARAAAPAPAGAQAERGRRRRQVLADAVDGG